MKSLFQFSGGDSFLHRLDPRPKFLVVLAVLAYVLLFEDPLYMLGAFVAVIAIIWVFGRIAPTEYWTLLIFFTPLIGAVMLIQGLTLRSADPEIVFALGPLEFSGYGLLFGASIGLRLATMGLTFMMFSMTTTPKNVGLALHKVGVPFRYAYLATFGLRFLPMMQSDLKTIQNARAVRGDRDVGSRNPFRRLKSLPMSFFPLAANSLRQSNETAKALELRGYGASEQRTTVFDLELRLMDYAVGVAMLAVIAAISYARFALTIGQLG
ncbi:energy-coupling factor transporter transmembrane component T family protein [Halorarum salinum]|uniref:Energy-coupling factor transporter transmembrane protein EcfT n=1 Tax=Halorarum salinum TaxID=2743089 RepID=A0A7D5Q918_9EURY|nr:energy-coupling factor transporter transmembrane component T [Halobaculum salinum]QLG60359.1 energy-coupling factor transporter transmembrane protein EcfT [Halobaculum salinum]